MRLREVFTSDAKEGMTVLGTVHEFSSNRMRPWDHEMVIRDVISRAAPIPGRVFVWENGVRSRFFPDWGGESCKFLVIEGPYPPNQSD